MGNNLTIDAECTMDQHDISEFLITLQGIKSKGIPLSNTLTNVVIENAYTAEAATDLLRNDPVIIIYGRCFRATDSNRKIYHVIYPCKINETAILAGDDTVIMIQ